NSGSMGSITTATPSSPTKLLRVNSESSPKTCPCKAHTNKRAKTKLHNRLRVAFTRRPLCRGFGSCLVSGLVHDLQSQPRRLDRIGDDGPLPDHGSPCSVHTSVAYGDFSRPRGEMTDRYRPRAVGARQ